MFKDRLRINLTERKKIRDITLSDSKFMQKSLGIIIILLFCFSGGLFFEQNLGAESQGRKIQSYVKNGTVLQARIREARILEQKNKGRKVKYYVLKKSVLQGRKDKAKKSADKMLDTGLITSKMIKNNRWFVKKPFQSSYTKVNIVSKYTPLKVNPEVSDKISREALQMSKTRARITGPVKPDIIYSKKVSREAMKMTLKRSQKAVSAGKTVSAGKDIVYSAITLIKMSKRPTIIYAPFKSEKAGEKKKTDAEKN